MTPTPLYQKIKLAILHRGLNFADVERALKFPTHTIHHWCRGFCRPSPSNRRKLLHFLNTHPPYPSPTLCIEDFDEPLDEVEKAHRAEAKKKWEKNQKERYKIKA